MILNYFSHPQAFTEKITIFGHSRCFFLFNAQVRFYTVHSAVLLKRGHQKNYQTRIRQNCGHVTHLTRRTGFLHQRTKNQHPRQTHCHHQRDIDTRQTISQRAVGNGVVLSQNLSVEKVFLAGFVFQ